MPRELGKARRSRDPEDELVRVVCIGADGQKAKVLDARTKDREVELKLEYVEGDLGWFALEPGDRIEVTERRKNRSASGELHEDSHPVRKRDTVNLLHRFLVRLSSGQECEVLHLSRNKNHLRVVIHDIEGERIINHNLQPGESVAVGKAAEESTRTAEVRHVIESPGSANSDSPKPVGVPTLGDAIRAQIAARIAEASVQDVKNEPDLQPVYHIRHAQAGCGQWTPPPPKTGLRGWFEATEWRQAAFYCCLAVLPILFSGVYIYKVYQMYYGPIPVPETSALDPSTEFALYAGETTGTRIQTGLEELQQPSAPPTTQSMANTASPERQLAQLSLK